MPHGVSHASNFLAVAAMSASLRNQRERQTGALAQSKHDVHTTLIDEGWDLEPSSGNSEQSESSCSSTPAPARTTLIDAQWDLEPVSHVAHRSGEHRIDANRTRTALVDTPWGTPPRAVDSPSGFPHVNARPRLLALVDTEEEVDPVITYFELEGPECLGLLESELD